MSESELITVEVSYDIRTDDGRKKKTRRFLTTPEHFEQMRTAEQRDKYPVAWVYVTGAIWRMESLMDNDVRVVCYHGVRQVKSRSSGEPSRWYTVYNRKTDELLASGTASDCTKALGLKNISGFYCVLSRTRSGRSRKYRICVYDRLSDLDEEDEA